MRANFTDEFQSKSPEDDRVSLTLVSAGPGRCVSGVSGVVSGGAAGLNTHTSYTSTLTGLAGGAELIAASERSADIQQSFIR